MGLMEPPRIEPGQLIVTPHPLLLDGQRNTVWDARPGESLYALLMRNVPELDGQPWAVSIGGLPVERHLWHHVYPKVGQVIEVRGGVGRSALAVVAMIALTYFTFGGGAIAGFSLGTASTLGTLAVQSAVYLAGSMLINKVLAPKPPKAIGQQQDSVYSISGARNQLRQYEPLPLLFGRVRITPDLLSKPYTWYEGNDQYLGLLLCAGVNVGRVEPFYNGDTELANYEGVQVYHAGYSQMPDQPIPLYSNADTIDGAVLTKDKAWVERTTSADTVRIQINLEYVLGGTGTSGKSYTVGETVEAQYRAVGAATWLPLVSKNFRSDRFDVRRATLAKDVARGQYDVRVRILGYGNYSGKNTQKNDFQWTTLTSMQADDADYTGVSRSGVRIKATDQLNGSPDELRAVGHADPIPVWDGAAWATVESSNPGAHILAYARGIVRGGRLLAGMALSDEQIDIESLKAFSLHCAANGYTYDCYIKDARNHDQVLAAIALAGFGQITWAGGRLGVVWVAQEQPLSGVVNMATIKKGQFQVDYSLSNAADGIEYTYLDSTKWETKTLRVPAPGITTMLNPAQVTGEGVTSEAHAACLARWHLAQSLYQYKDIGYSTDIEHLSYQRLSLLALQHDMTQWGFGGRVQGVLLDGAPAVADAEVERVRFVNGESEVFTAIERVAVDPSGKSVSLILDEPAPAPATGNAYIGLRIPGERVYRVLRVKPFAGESNVIELLDAWPSDAAVPGNSPDNPAHDTLWVYDFKQTPGLRVRVVSVEPESDLKGAAVRVVQEGPEFWNYVLTGHYIPSPNESQLQTRPAASNLRITEQQVVQGDTQFTELTATFDITGPVGNILVLAAGQEQELREVAQTQTRSATWRIARADVYSIVVRPFAPDGTAGVAASATYATEGADAPPVLVDLFDVQEGSGGVRLYTWGWLEGTMRSADFAGVEIRHIAGHVTAPDWDAMTPIGESGYHTAAFEAVVPISGDWTFACRSRNTSGELSVGMRVITRTLTHNLGEQIGGIGDSLEEITRKQAEEQTRLDAEIRDRALEDLQYAQQAAADATAKANAARDTAIAYADAIGAQVADILDADEWVSTKTYPKGDLVKRSGKLYRALSASANKAPESNAAIWQLIGNYTSLGEAVAASVSMGTQNTSDIAAQSSQLNAVTVRMPTGTDKLANEARVVAVEQAAATATGAVSTKLGTVEARMPAGTGALATATDAAAAAAAAQAAATLAGGKGEVIYGASAPTVAQRLAQNLWIDTSANANTPKRWNGTAWAAVTDKVATDAVAAAAAALARANDVDARVTTVESASVSRDTALGNRTTTIEGRLPTGTDQLANEARVVMAEQASVARDSVLSESLAAVRSSLSAGGDNLITNSEFPNIDGWVAGSSGQTGTTITRITGTGSSIVPDSMNAIRVQTTAGVAGSYMYALCSTIGGVQPGKRYMASAWLNATVASGGAFLQLRYLDAAGLQLSGGSINSPKVNSSNNEFLLDANRVSCASVAPAGAVAARLYVRNDFTTSANYLLDVIQPMVEEVSAEQVNPSPYMPSLKAKADAAALSSLSSKVELVDGKVAINSAAITQVSGKLGGGSNMLADSDFASGSVTTAWTFSKATGNTTAGMRAVGNEWSVVAAASRTAEINQSDGDTVNPVWAELRQRVGVEAGKAYQFSVYAGNHRCNGALFVRFYSDANVEIGNSYSTRTNMSPTAKSGGKLLSGYERYAHNVTPPAGTATVEVCVRKMPTLSGTSSFIFLTRAQFCEVADSAQSVVPWTDGAAGMFATITDMKQVSTGIDGRLKAKVTNAVDVNGNISGTVSENDGTRSSYSILANVFRVVTGAAASGMEWQANYIRIYGTGYQLVMGTGFGSDGNLVQWFGANVGAANCTTANCIECKTTSGQTFIRGSNAQGSMEISNTLVTIRDNNNVKRAEFGLLVD